MPAKEYLSCTLLRLLGNQVQVKAQGALMAVLPVKAQPSLPAQQFALNRIYCCVLTVPAHNYNLF